MQYQSEFSNETFNTLIDRIKVLNREMVEDKSLGRGFRIGPAIFAEGGPESVQRIGCASWSNLIFSRCLRNIGLMSRPSCGTGKTICVVCLMTNDKGIFIKNIYYMLSYAFQVLKQSNYEQIAAEEFDMAQDLFAEILAKGVSRQLKQGSYKEYIPKCETLSVMRGKMDMRETIINKMQHKQKLTCEFDELSENNLYNQILKTTMRCLVKDKYVTPERKSSLNKALLFFDGVSLLEPSEIVWSKLNFRRGNQNYEMLMNICYFVLDGMLQTTENGEYKMSAFSDEHMARLYEKFILEYYKVHRSYLTEVKAAQIKWDLTDENDESMIRFLPVMQTDIFLRKKDKILIIDAKYYGKTLQQQFDKYTLHSENIYQIYTYVKNQNKDNTGNVSGLLLYAKTEELITPDCALNIGGNRIGAKTLDMNADFRVIAAQLDGIAEKYFGNHE